MMKKIIALVLAARLILSACSCTNTRATDTVAFDKKSARVIAHRGLSGLEIENTEADISLSAPSSDE